jgi:hypothetical protein
VMRIVRVVSGALPRGATLAFVLLALAGCGSSDATNAPRTGNPAVYERIASETDCAALQHEFDTADVNHTRDLGRDRLDLADVDVAYMNAADDRMREIGCYG